MVELVTLRMRLQRGVDLAQRRTAFSLSPSFIHMRRAATCVFKNLYTLPLPLDLESTLELRMSDLEKLLPRQSVAIAR